MTNWFNHLSLTHAIFACLTSGCANFAYHEGEAVPISQAVWCLEGASAEERGLVEDGIFEWNRLAGTRMRLGAEVCDRLIEVREVTPGYGGEWNQESIALAPLLPRIGVYELDCMQFRYSVLHELGHALGLAHSPVAEDVMFFAFDFQEGLTEGDVRAFRDGSSGSVTSGAK